MLFSSSASSKARSSETSSIFRISALRPYAVGIPSFFNQRTQHFLVPSFPSLVFCVVCCAFIYRGRACVRASACACLLACREGLNETRRRSRYLTGHGLRTTAARELLRQSIQCTLQERTSILLGHGSRWRWFTTDLPFQGAGRSKFQGLCIARACVSSTFPTQRQNACLFVRRLVTRTSTRVWIWEAWCTTCSLAGSLPG